MSYDIRMNCDHCNTIVSVEPFQEGGTQPIGGTDQACLNVTYNYSSHYRRLIDSGEGIRWLYGKQGKDCIGRLREAISQLKDDESDNYWDPTEGNAKAPLKRLLCWAEQHPTAIFSGD